MTPPESTGIRWSEAPLFGRRTTILETLRKLEASLAGPPTIVESGTARSYDGRIGDGWSTVAWAWFAARLRGRVWTVDPNAAALECARVLTRRYAGYVEFVRDDAARVLAGWSSTASPKIDLLYLDGLDHHDAQASEKQCADEARAALPHLAEDGLVLLDDTLCHGGEPDRELWRGKGARAVPALLATGFEVVFSRESQTLLCRTSVRRAAGEKVLP